MSAAFPASLFSRKGYGRGVGSSLRPPAVRVSRTRLRPLPQLAGVEPQRELPNGERDAVGG